MSRPSKRPRLHFLPSVSPDPDGELATARARNDGLLKTRWEEIFTRYERDFDGVGDEISMLEDTIVVDNGHIKSMRNARDTGTAGFAEHFSESPSKYDGRQLLRAMTVAPSENSEDSVSNHDADEVLHSIETIADNIITQDEYSEEGSSEDEISEDELFNVHSETEPVLYGRSASPQGMYEHEEWDMKYESDIDELFDNRPVMRSPSIDDLFETTSPAEHQTNFGPVSRWNRMSYEMTQTPDTSLGSVPPRETINRDFIREEIRKAIEEENQIQESKIDPAWRIPVRLTSATISKPAIVAAPAELQQAETEVSDDGLDEHEEDSVWKLASRTRRPKREVAAERNLKRLRAESEDPLQDGFTSDAEPPPEFVPDKRSLSKQISPPIHEPSPDREPSPIVQQLRATTSVDQADTVRLSEGASTAQTQPTKVAPQVKALPKPRKRSKTDSSAIIVQVPPVPQKVAKRKSKG
ncbi:hypothetical protein ES702_04676 [subsurface metagenome]